MLVAAFAKQQVLIGTMTAHAFDAQLAQKISWQALGEAESWVRQQGVSWDHSDFSCSCQHKQGLCTTSIESVLDDDSICVMPPWMRYHSQDGQQTAKLFLDEETSSRQAFIRMGSAKARYLVEFLGGSEEDDLFYRITARAHGQNLRTVSVVQSYYVLHKDGFGERLSARYL